MNDAILAVIVVFFALSLASLSSPGWRGKRGRKSAKLVLITLIIYPLTLFMGVYTGLYFEAINWRPDGLALFYANIYLIYPIIWVMVFDRLSYGDTKELALSIFDRSCFTMIAVGLICVKLVYFLLLVNIVFDTPSGFGALAVLVNAASFILLVPAITGLPFKRLLSR